MASIRKVANRYRAEIYVKGQRDSQVFRTKREAEAWAARRETELREQEKKTPGERHTLREAFEKYRLDVSPKKRGARWEDVRLQAFLREDALPIDLPMCDVTSEHFKAWRDHRLKIVTAGTVLRDFGLISAVLEEARREWKWVDTNVAKDVRRPRAPDHREVVITLSQIRIMLKTMGHRPGRNVRSVSQSAAVAFLLALRSGMRAGELCGLVWSRVFDGYCTTPHKAGKTNDSLREVPLTAKAMRLLERMRGFDDLLVFGIKVATLDSLFRRYRIRAGLSGFTFHDSRHTAATRIASRMKSTGMPAQQAVLDLCKIFGWSNINQALVYYNPSAADIAKRMG